MGPINVLFLVLFQNMRNFLGSTWYIIVIQLFVLSIRTFLNCFWRRSIDIAAIEVKKHQFTKNHQKKYTVQESCPVNE